MTSHVSGLYPWPFDGDLRPENTALIIIDMQIDFCGVGGWVHSRGVDLRNTRRAIAPLQTLLDVLRPAGVTIIHTREGHRPDLSDLPANKLWRSQQLNGNGIGAQGPLGRYLIRGEPNWDIIPELAPAPGEIIIDKPGKGAFMGTDLDTVLRNRGIRNLMIAGVTTDCCVQSTLRDANDRGFECLLLEDCCGAATHANHDAQVEMLRLSNGLYGSISTSGAVIATLTGAAA
ncbi:cysteine hydrolase [Citreicella sp. C3M06]|uniref:cysteine hydrolase family protein n=1 Tax=Citreicella sp. C3M06 TaxID=2841564 RepID=UPI001C099146|nr:isochorismatase family cysteine hydrolase [Citreicella sp. C3M06]MBU2961413.1 cysteine hydrolase [Citreicella sp. C3M06]